MMNRLISLAFFIGSIGSFLAIWYAFQAYEGMEAWRATARFTARVSLIVFLILFVSNNLKWFDYKQINKLFMAYTLAMVIHLTMLLTFNIMRGEIPFNIRLAGGFSAYFFLLITPFLYFFLNEKVVRIFRILTLITSFALFTLTYVFRIWLYNNNGGTFQEYVIGLTIMGLAGLFWIFMKILPPKLSA
jgi:hypothetical protein